MSKETKIEWCDSTVNPTDFQCCGCELWNKKVKDCYAGRFAERRAGKGAFDKPVVLKPGRMAEAARWSDLSASTRHGVGKPWLNLRPRVIFIGDMADTLQPDVPFTYLKQEIIDVVMSVEGRRHVWMWLTKQAKRMVEFQDWLAGPLGTGISWPENLWPGVSVTSERTTWRIDELVKINSEYRFISYEPAWGPVDFSRWTCERDYTEFGKDVCPSYKLRLIITGGNSGSKRKPYNLSWAASTIETCETDHVDCFVKQLGTMAVCDNANLFDFPDDAQLIVRGQGFAQCRLKTKHPKGGDMAEWPEQLRVRQFPDFLPVPVTAGVGTKPLLNSHQAKKTP